MYSEIFGKILGMMIDRRSPFPSESEWNRARLFPDIILMTLQTKNAEI
jgi:hypothetical protein